VAVIIWLPEHFASWRCCWFLLKVKSDTLLKFNSMWTGSHTQLYFTSETEYWRDGRVLL